MNRSLAILALASLAGAVSAQTTATRAIPRVCTDAYGGSTAFATPLGSFRAQYWYAGDNLPIGQVITRIGVRARRNASTAAQSREVQIVMDNSSVTFGTMDGTFANNLSGGATTFHARKSVSTTAVPGTTDPNSAAAWFVGDQPFVFTGPHLVIDFTGGTGTGTLLNDGLLTTPPGAISEHLQGRSSCGGQLNSSYDGANVLLTATGLLSTSPCVILVAFENVTLGAADLPINLMPFGFGTGCIYAVNPFADTTVMSDMGGTATFSMPYTTPPGTTLTFSAQAFHFRIPSPVTLNDIVSTNAVHSTLGFQGLCNTTFATPEGQADADSGPNPINSAVVLLLR